MFVWIFFFVPETKDRTLEEIDEMFEARLPARKFKGCVCVESLSARRAGLQVLGGMSDTKAESNVEHLEHA